MERTPGYAGPDGYTDTWDPNDQADRAAKHGAAGHPETLVDVVDLPGKPIATIKKIVFKAIMNQWKHEYIHWENSKLGICEMTHFRKFWPTIDPSKANKVLDNLGHSRKDFSLFVQLTSGSDYLNNFGYKLGEADYMYCDQCKDQNTKENFEHLIKCPALTNLQENNFASFPFTKEPSCLPVREVACYLRALDNVIGLLPDE